MMEILMDNTAAWLCLAFFSIAFFYSMAGLGGGSSYLALLVLAGLPYQEVCSTALFCNVIVASIGFWNFRRAGHFRFRKVLPFSVLSVPMAFFGGSFTLEEKLFRFLLGSSLLIASARIFLSEKSFEIAKEIPTRRMWAIGLSAGGVFGFLSGLVGIGGGIFLSPLLLLMRWANIKEAAASASFFIVVNSLSGLAGQLQKGAAHPEWIFPLGFAVFLGGQIGSRISAYQMPKLRLQQLLAALVLYVAVKLLIEAVG